MKTANPIDRILADIECSGGHIAKEDDFGLPLQYHDFQDDLAVDWADHLQTF